MGCHNNPQRIWRLLLGLFKKFYSIEKLYNIFSSQRPDLSEVTNHLLYYDHKLFPLRVYLSDLLNNLAASQQSEIPTKKTAKPIYFALDNGPNKLTIACFLGILICVVHGLYKRTLKGSSLSQKYNRGNIC